MREATARRVIPPKPSNCVCFRSDNSLWRENPDVQSSRLRHWRCQKRAAGEQTPTQDFSTDLIFGQIVAPNVLAAYYVFLFAQSSRDLHPQIHPEAYMIFAS